ncbi:MULTISPECIES: endolytic transglycosylase MltG [Streptococcus]|uniref:endolytic transglycosylase MltG n=1 Tax=Streptococcus TaxID=1301 RepID=UPI0012DED4A2|nr:MULTISPECIES: endolytic transglycosylase MltG [Streptococcus]QHF55191.1 aminodeoxychorismate lyase [Streptococcus sp. DAT741]
MTKDTNEKNTQSSSFRDQILRDLEALKVNRLAEQSAEVLVDKKAEVINELQATVAEDEEMIKESGSVKIDSLAFSDSYLAEEDREPKKAGGHFEEKGSEATIDTASLVDEKANVSSPVPQDTVERNLEKLRNLVAANAAEFNEAPSSDTVSQNVEPPIQGHPVLEDTFLEFPTEDVSKVTGDTGVLSLDETIIAAKALASVPETKEQPLPTQSRRKSSHRMSKQRRKKQDKAAKRIVSIIMSIIVVVVLMTGFIGYAWVKSSLEPVDVKATKAISVEIPKGSSTLEIGEILVNNKLIKNATIFNYYSKIKSYNNFQSGFYNLKQSMSVDDIAKALQESGTPTPQKESAGKILIVEGYTLKQIARAVTVNTKTGNKNEKTPFTAEQFMATVTNQDFINRMVAAYPKLFASLPAANSGVLYQLEGYLFPAIYEYAEDTTMEELVEQMIAAMDARLKPHYDTIAAKNLTVNELLTLASLVEKEGAKDEDRRNIASVFLNRLNSGMPLQSNIALLYAQGKLGQETTLAEDAAIDTSIESPYNIYWKPGLMPGPVDSPSLSAIEAILNANSTDYLYFVADVTTGKVYFANNIEEHNQNVAKYVNAHLQ